MKGEVHTLIFIEQEVKYSYAYTAEFLWNTLSWIISKATKWERQQTGSAPMMRVSESTRLIKNTFVKTWEIREYS